MTCIVGFLEKETDTVWIGADSLGSNGFTKEVYNDKKVFHSKDTDEMVIGFTTSYRMGDILKYSNDLIDKVDVLENKEIDREYIVTKTIPRISSLFADGKYERNKSGEAEGGSFLIGIKNKLYKVQDDYSVLENSCGYDSVGCGKYHAMGALYTIRDMDFTPVERITKALESAEHHTCGVKRPFVIMNTKTNDVVVID